MAEVALRVMVVDDHQVVREGIVALLGREPDMRIVAAVESGELAVAMIDAAKPDLVLLDYRLPGMSGATACRRILHLRPNAIVVMLSSFATDEVILACFAAGATSYLSKDVVSTDLPTAVRAAATGESILSPHAATLLVNWVKLGGVGQANDDCLTSMEVEVLAMISAGMSNEQIGQMVFKSEAMIKVYVHSLTKKLGSKRRWDAVAVGLERGLL